MLNKVIIFICTASIVSAGNLLSTLVAYSSAPISSVAFTTTHGSPITYNNAPFVYAATSPVLKSAVSYEAPVFKTYSPSITSYSVAPVETKAVYAAPIQTSYVAKSAAPAVSYQSFYLEPSVSSYSRVVAKSYAAPAVSYNAPVSSYSAAPSVSYSVLQAQPLVAKTVASVPVVAKSPVAPVTYAAPLSYASAPYAYAATAPLLKSGLTYSSAPAVSSVNYVSDYANYAW